MCRIYVAKRFQFQYIKLRIDKLLDIFKHTYEKYRCTLQARKNEGDNFYHSFDCLYTGRKLEILILEEVKVFL